MPAVLQLETLLVKLMGDSTQFDAMIDRLENKLAGLVTRFASYGQGMARSLLLPLGIAAGLVAREFVSIDDAITRSMINMGEAGDAAKSAFKNTVFNVSTNSINGPADLAKALTSLGRAGMSTAEALKVLADVDRFSVATGMDLQESTKALAQAQVTLGMVSRDVATDQSNLGHIMDVVARSSQIGQTSALEMAEALGGRGGASIRQHKISLEDATAALLAFSSAGVHGNAAGQLLSNTLKQLESSATKHADVWKQLGINIYDTKGQMLPLTDIAGMLAKRFDGLDDKSRQNALNMLGFNARLADGVKLMTLNADQMREWQKQLLDASGTVGKMSDQYLASFTGQLMRLRNILIEVGNTIAEDLAPLLLELTDYVKMAVEWWNNLSAPLRRVIVTTLAVAAALTLATLVIGGVIGLIASAATTIWGFVSAVWGIVTAVATFAASPWGIAILAVVVAVGALVYALVGSDGLLAAWDAVTQGAYDFAMGTVGALYNFRENAGIVSQWFKDNWQNMLIDVMNLTGTIIKNGLYAEFVTPFMVGFEMAWATGKWFERNFEALWGDLAEGASRFFHLLPEYAVVATAVMIQIFAVWGKYFSQLMMKLFTWDFISAVWTGLSRAFMGFVEFIRAIGAEFRKLFDKLSMAMVEALKGNAAGVGMIFKSTMNDAPGILEKAFNKIKPLMFGEEVKDPFADTMKILQDGFARLRNPFEGMKGKTDFNELFDGLGAALGRGMKDLNIFQGFEAQTKALGLNFLLPEGIGKAIDDMFAPAKERKENALVGDEQGPVAPPGKTSDFKMVNTNLLSIKGLAGFGDIGDKNKVNGPKLHNQLGDILKALLGNKPDPALGK